MSRDDFWGENSRRVTAVRRAGISGWNAAYHPAGVSHFPRATLQAQGAHCHPSPRRTGVGEHPPLPACLYKSSALGRLPGQVWAFELRCEVISAMRAQECALSDFPL